MQIDQNIIVFIQELFANRHFCIKYLDENNNILEVDTSELTVGGVQTPGNSSSNWAVQEPLLSTITNANHDLYNVI